MPSRPAHIQVKRAKVIVDDEGQKFLDICKRCHEEKYILAGRTVCSDCLTPRKKNKSRR